MAKKKGIFGILGKGTTPSEPDKYIDLSEYIEEERKGEETPATMRVHVGEVYRHEDIGDLTKHVYDGNILLIDYTPLSGDELQMKRITNDLKVVAKDVRGDLAGIGKNLLMLTPTGVKIEKRKIRGSYWFLKQKNSFLK